MATEERFITLTDTEFADSLQSYRRTHPDFLPSGEVVGWKPGKETKIIDVTMKIKGGSSINQMVFTIEAQDVVEILTRFCIENNIPVPFVGIKEWSRREKGITLSIALRDRELERANIEMAMLA